MSQEEDLPETVRAARVAQGLTVIYLANTYGAYVCARPWIGRCTRGPLTFRQYILRPRHVPSASLILIEVQQACGCLGENELPQGGGCPQ